MDAITRLSAIEEIKRLKAKYFLGVDTQDWDLIRREVITGDVSFQLSEFREEPYIGADKVLGMFNAGLAGKKSVHHGHMPVVELQSESEATGIWAMEDRIYIASPGSFLEVQPILHGFGHYREKYTKLDQGWRICDIQLTRLRLESRNFHRGS